MLELIIDKEHVGASLPMWGPDLEAAFEDFDQVLRKYLFVNNFKSVRTPNVAVNIPWSNPDEETKESFQLQNTHMGMHDIVAKEIIKSYRSLPLRFYEHTASYKMPGGVPSLTWRYEFSIYSISVDDLHAGLNVIKDTAYKLIPFPLVEKIDDAAFETSLVCKNSENVDVPVFRQTILWPSTADILIKRHEHGIQRL